MWEGVERSQCGERGRVGGEAPGLEAGVAMCVYVLGEGGEGGGGGGEGGGEQMEGADPAEGMKRSERGG